MSRLKLLYLFLLVGFFPLEAQTVTDFRPFTAKCSMPPFHQAWIVLRKFNLNLQCHYLLVNPDNLMTRVRPAEGLMLCEEKWEDISQEFKDTPYFQALADAQTHSDLIQDAGITHIGVGQKGIILTMDLCPSTNPMDRSLFSELLKEFREQRQPIPIGVAVSGSWLKNHLDDLLWLLDLQRKERVLFTWINHSYHHRIGHNLSLKENALLEKRSDLKLEILQNEAKMIENGLTPSVFFRFPGLVSDKKHLDQLSDYGLIPLGSDAWLGKNQWPTDGSIILIHANGNEPIGIKRFLKWLRRKKKNIVAGQWLLFDLRQGLMEQEKIKMERESSSFS